MQWITIIWSVVAGVCLALAMVHVLIWLRRRTAGHLFLSISSLSAAAIAGFELAGMRAQSPEQYGQVVQWAMLPIFVLTVSLVFFIRVHLKAGRDWLMWVVVFLRTLVISLNFALTPNLHFTEITAIRQVPLFGGESISVAEGETRSLSPLGPLSQFALLAFAADAMVQVWRRGDRRRAVTICGSTILFISLATVHSPLVLWGVIDSPFLISICYLAVVIAMAHELSADVAGAAALGRRLEASQEQLRESEQRMDLAATAVGLGMWRWDIGTDRLWISDSGRRLFGLSEDAPIDLDRVLSLIQPQDRQGVLHAIARSMNGDGDYESEFRVVLPDGSVQWIRSHGRAEFDGQGKACCLLGVAIDVTSHKQAELEAHQRREELAHLSRVMMLGELSGSIAHELNQPLAAILSNAEAAQKLLTRDSPDLKELCAILDEIVEDDTRAGEVIRRLRILLKRGEPARQKASLNDVIRDVLRLVHRDLDNRGVRVETELQEMLPVVQVDPIQVQQVLINLILNACEAMSETAAGERVLTIRTWANGSQCVSFSVRDRGCGLPDANVHRVFESFYTTKPHGMGLGLPVCRTIIAAHGGKLWAENGPGRGACFHVEVPAGATGGAN